jgi:hypothetical protein
MLRIAITLLKQVEDQIVNMDIEELSVYIKNFARDLEIDSQRFMKQVYSYDKNLFETSFLNSIHFEEGVSDFKIIKNNRKGYSVVSCNRSSLTAACTTNLAFKTKESEAYEIP